MSWLSSFLNPGKGYGAAQQQLENYYNQAQGYQQPYNQQGIQQAGNLNAYINSLMNPGALQDQWIKQYQESDATKNLEDMAKQYGLDAASSMGLMGSSSALNAIQSGTTNIANQARQQYLDDLMQKYLAGAGLSQGLYNTGANAGSQMGQNAMTQGQNTAQMAFNKQNAGGSMFGGLLGLGGGILGSALGGPIGGALAKRWNLAGG